MKQQEDYQMNKFSNSNSTLDMEKLSDFEQKSLVDELNKGRELANELKKHIGRPKATNETCEQLVQKILSSYDNALAVLCWRGLLQQQSSPAHGLPAGDDPNHQCHRDVSKKRKRLQRWSNQVRVSAGTGLHCHVDDGYSWRKYGQKEILGAKFPRAYYRCTHRHTKGCAATKLVQRSDEDSSILEVTYRGNHTCIQTSTTDSLEEEKAKEKDSCFLQQLKENQKQEADVLFQFGQGLKVETEKSDPVQDRFPSFSFQSTPAKSESPGSRIFWEPLEDDIFLGTSFAPPFTSSATSEPNCSVSLSQRNNYWIGHKWPSSENDLTHVNSTPTSLFDLDLCIDQWGFDPNFPHDYHF